MFAERYCGTIPEVVHSGLCVGCGACAGVSQGRVRMVEDPRSGMPEPRGDGTTNSDPLLDRKATAICPGKGYKIVGIAEHLFPAARFGNLALGRWEGLYAARSTSRTILRDASSGGLITTICLHLLQTRRVVGCVVTKMEYGRGGPRPRAFIARSAAELQSAQGSKYCPVPALESLAEMDRADGPLAFVGTPCQVASLRMLQREEDRWRARVPYAIGTFCGGVRDLRETDMLIRRAGFRPADVTRLRYRGGGQPGSMAIEEDGTKQAILPYPDYVRATGFPKHLRCRLCVDATSELADFSCGDAWLRRFLATGRAWSILLARSPAACAIVREMVADGTVVLEAIEPLEVGLAQAENLASKKQRQVSRRRLYRRLRRKVPMFDGGYSTGPASVARELKVLLHHKALYALEKLQLYPTVARFLRRYPHISR